MPDTPKPSALDVKLMGRKDAERYAKLAPTVPATPDTSRAAVSELLRDLANDYGFNARVAESDDLYREVADKFPLTRTGLAKSRRQREAQLNALADALAQQAASTSSDDTRLNWREWKIPDAPLETWAERVERASRGIRKDTRSFRWARELPDSEFDAMADAALRAAFPELVPTDD